MAGWIYRMVRTPNGRFFDGGDAGLICSKMATPDAKRNAVAHARETFGLIERRACSLIGVAKRVVRSELTRPADVGLRLRCNPT